MDLKYPKTRKQNVTDTYFGIKVDDPYRWLEDDNAPETKAWVEDQNKVTESYLSSIPFRKALKQRLTSLVSYTRYSGAFHKKGKVYFYRNNGLQNQSVLYVQDGQSGTPRMLLDPNTFSADGTTVLTDFIVSQNGRYAAFGQSSGGSAARCLPARIDVVVVAPLLPFNIIIIPVSAYSSLFSFFLFV